MSKQTTDVRVGPYHFTITDSENRHSSRILSRVFTMGGTYPDCANVSIHYDLQNRPTSASIPYVVSDPECSKGVPLDRGEGSVLMLKILLRHIHEKIPSITRFSFVDMSNIECGTEDEQRSRRHPKKGTYARPIPLNYFSIAFNGCTWYEKRFRAMYKDEHSHAEYRKCVDDLLTEEKMPPFIDFIQQLPENNSLIKNKAVYDDLQALYEGARTFGELFRSISRERRCTHARLWLISFLTHRLSGVFSHENWIIDITLMDESIAWRGGVLLRKKKRRGTRKREYTFYVPRGFCREGGYQIGHFLNLDPITI